MYLRSKKKKACKHVYNFSLNYLSWILPKCFSLQIIILGLVTWEEKVLTYFFPLLLGFENKTGIWSLFIGWALMLYLCWVTWGVSVIRLCTSDKVVSYGALILQSAGYSSHDPAVFWRCVDEDSYRYYSLIYRFCRNESWVPVGDSDFTLSWS